MIIFLLGCILYFSWDADDSELLLEKASTSIAAVQFVSKQSSEVQPSSDIASIFWYRNRYKTLIHFSMNKFIAEMMGKNGNDGPRYGAPRS